MANFFATTSNDSVRITDGTDTLAVTTDGTIIDSKDVKVQENTASGTSRTDTYTVPAGKYWILKRTNIYRGATGQVNQYLKIDSTNRQFNFFSATGGTNYVENIQDIRLKAGDAYVVNFNAGSSGVLYSTVYYEEYDE